MITNKISKIITDEKNVGKSHFFHKELAVAKGDDVTEEEQLHPTLVRYYNGIFSLTPFVTNSPIDGEKSNACYACQSMNDVKFSKVCSEENNDVDKGEAIKRA